MVDVYLGIGSNIDAHKNIAKGKLLLETVYPQVLFSRSFESASIGFDGDNFINLVAKISLVDGDLSAVQLLDDLVKLLKNIENKLGRARGGEKFSSRVMDIDILLFGDRVSASPIELPREEILDNAYVLWPLSELAPELVHPVEKLSYTELWNNFDKNKQQLKPIDA